MRGTVVAVVGVVALLAGSTADPAGAASSAYGISVPGSIDPTPVAISTAGEPAHGELPELGPDQGLSVGLLTVDALGGAARTSVADVDLPGRLTAGLVSTSCRNGVGTVEIMDGSSGGRKLPARPVAGQRIDVSPLLTVTLGGETRNDDDSITVTGIEVTGRPGATVRIGSATCHGGVGELVPAATAEAPPPEVVEADLPVTG